LAIRIAAEARVRQQLSTEVSQLPYLPTAFCCKPAYFFEGDQLAYAALAQ